MTKNVNFDVSVIIPNLHSPTAHMTVKSILDQNPSLVFEVIVVGMDKFHVLDIFQDQIKFIDTGAPVSPGEARNIGVSHSKGNCLVFIDSDALAIPGFLDLHFQYNKIYLNTIVGGAVTFTKNNFLKLCDNISTFHEYMPHMPAGTKRMIPTVNMSISRNYFDLLRGFNSEFAGEDTDFSIRAKKKGLSIYFSPNILVKHNPNRQTVPDLINHTYNLGKHSKIFKNFLKNKATLNRVTDFTIVKLFSSPFIALVIILKIILLEKLPLEYWYTLPVIYLLKCIWGYGALSFSRE